MLRDRSRAPRTLRRHAALAAAALVIAAASGCGIKGPLKRVDATAVPAAPADPSAPAPAESGKSRLP
jgi:predicted small lipoprotein YifL